MASGREPGPISPGDYYAMLLDEYRTKYVELRRVETRIAQLYDAIRVVEQFAAPTPDEETDRGDET